MVTIRSVDPGNTAMKNLRCFILGCLIAVLVASAAANADGPASLVITYRAKAETRVAFRTWFETKGAAQFARWKSAGVFADAQILFGSLAANAPIDAVVILDFTRYTDSAQWKQVERQFPGGLPPEALQLATPASAHYADVISRGARATRDPAKAACLVAFYEVLADMSKYRDYARGYVEPQMHGWIESGALSGFTLLANQAPLHHPWDALLVLEYTDLAGLARRDEVKKAVRTRLAATDPVWVEWSKDKSDMRKELSLFIADTIVLPAAH
jgi:hypothetical protein